MLELEEFEAFLASTQKYLQEALKGPEYVSFIVTGSLASLIRVLANAGMDLRDAFAFVRKILDSAEITILGELEDDA